VLPPTLNRKAGRKRLPVRRRKFPLRVTPYLTIWDIQRCVRPNETLVRNEVTSVAVTLSLSKED
jgi:hypothetical protein